MPIINITENDLTAVQTFGSDTDIVFVPGLVTTDASNFAQYELRVFRSKADFIAQCGEPYKFSTNQDYIQDDVATVAEGDEGEGTSTAASYSGFHSNAIPTEKVMFKSGTADPGYLYAIELLNAGLTVVYQRLNPKGTTTGITIKDIYGWLATAFGQSDEDYKTGLYDKGANDFKYLTTGGYPVYEYSGNTIVSAMLTIAANRGDCVALIDHTHNVDRATDITAETSLYYTVTQDTSFSGSNSAYGAMFTPGAEYNITTNAGGITTAVMPASFGYLLSLASSIQSNASWLAIAGAARGRVPNLAQNGIRPIANGVADMMQPRNERAINAITNISPYGEVIWGNRTLYTDTDLVARSFLNVRNLVSDVKKVCYQVARSLTFEQDNDVTWINFKSSIAPTLDRMVSGYGISGYKIVKDEESLESKQRATICAKVYLYPVYPVEDFHISITITDDAEVTVGE